MSQYLYDRLILINHKFYIFFLIPNFIFILLNLINPFYLLQQAFILYSF